ncbi:hypothetical protein VIRA109638_09240 [Vibrio rarus]
MMKGRNLGCGLFCLLKEGLIHIPDGCLVKVEVYKSKG